MLNAREEGKCSWKWGVWIFVAYEWLYAWLDSIVELGLNAFYGVNVVSLIEDMLEHLKFVSASRWDHDSLDSTSEVWIKEFRVWYLSIIKYD